MTFFSLLFFLSWPTKALGSPLLEFYQLTDPALQQAARAMAVKVPKKYITPLGDGAIQKVFIIRPDYFPNREMQGRPGEHLRPGPRFSPFRSPV